MADTVKLEDITLKVGASGESGAVSGLDMNNEKLQNTCALQYDSELDASGSATQLDNAKSGWLWRVNVAGTLLGQPLLDGDQIYCKTEVVGTPINLDSFNLIPSPIGVLRTTDIINNLTSTASNKGLGAGQGKVLNDNKIDKVLISAPFDTNGTLADNTLYIGGNNSTLSNAPTGLWEWVLYNYKYGNNHYLQELIQAGKLYIRTKSSPFTGTDDGWVSIGNSLSNPIKSDSDGSSYWTGIGTGNSVPALITAGQLGSLGLGTIGSGSWSFLTTNADSEAAAFFQNGNTTGFTSPGDNDALHWFDEDSPGAAAWKITTAGAIVTVSDKYLKKDIKTIDHKNTYKKFKKFNFVSFKWRLDAKNKRLKNLLEIAKVKKDVKKIKFYEECIEYHSQNDYGIIAQEFLKDVGLPGIIEKSTGCGFRANYQQLFVYACSVIQELQSLVEEKASSIPMTVSEAKEKEYKNGEIVNIREFNSGTKEALGYFQATLFTVKPPWYTKDIPDLIYKTNDKTKEVYLLNMQFNAAFSLTFASEDAINNVKSLLNNSAAILFNSENKKAAMIIDNKIKYLKFEE